MQEVETSYFAVLEEDLGESGFQGIHEPHYQGQNGLATFYNTQRFKMQKSVSHNFNELLSKLYDLDQFDQRNKFNQRVVIFSHLIEVKTGKPIVIGTVLSALFSIPFSSPFLPDYPIPSSLFMCIFFIFFNYFLCFITFIVSILFYYATCSMYFFISVLIHCNRFKTAFKTLRFDAPI